MIEIYRNQIDNIDEKIIGLLAERSNIVKKIGIYKKEHNIDIHQPKRRNQVLISCCKKGNSLGLSDTYIKSVWNCLHEEALRVENL